MRRILARLLALALLATTGGDADTDVGTESDAVNDWGSQCTAGRIPELPPPGFITAQTVLVLTNATYFEADWQTPFGKYGTISSDFTRLDGTTVPDEGRFAEIADRIDQTCSSTYRRSVLRLAPSTGSRPAQSSMPPPMPPTSRSTRLRSTRSARSPPQRPRSASTRVARPSPS